MTGTNTPWFSSQATPSTTGRSGRLTVPAASGARTVKVNDAVPPGATLASFCTATRLADGHPAFIPIAAYEVSSPLTPSETWLPATPFCHVFVPVLRNCSVTPEVAAGWSAGTVDWPAQSACRPLSLGTEGEAVLIVEPVLKSHSLVTICDCTLMSNRTWYVVFAASGFCGMMTW